MNFVNLVLGSSSNQTNTKQLEDELFDKELDNILNHPVPQYSEAEYWESRYSSEPEPFEWYQTWSNLSPVVLPKMVNPGNVLDVGCGNSSVCSELVKENFDVTGIDISSCVIKHNKENYVNEETKDKLKFICCDCLSMKDFQDESFDYVFDKGTLDSLICSSESNKIVPNYIKEISRVLKKGGIYFVVSYGTPNTRTIHFNDKNSELQLIDTKEIEKPTEKGTYHYVYFVQKK